MDQTTAAIIVAIVGAIVAGIFGIFGAFIGGAFAIAGGYLAARYTVGQEKKAKEQDQFEDFLASVRVVRAELASNTATLDSYLKLGGQLVHQMDDELYRRVQLLLFRRLPEPLRVQLFHAYAMLPFATGNVQFIASGKSQNPAQAQVVIKSVRDDLEAANNALADYLANTLNVSVI